MYIIYWFYCLYVACLYCSCAACPLFSELLLVPLLFFLENTRIKHSKHRIKNLLRCSFKFSVFYLMFQYTTCFNTSFLLTLFRGQYCNSMASWVWIPPPPISKGKCPLLAFPHQLNLILIIPSTQLAFTFSKLIIETQWYGVKYV